MDDGIRTRDNWNHNPGLYQLSYAHHHACLSAEAISCGRKSSSGQNPRRLPMRLPMTHRPITTTPVLHAQFYRQQTGSASKYHLLCEASPVYFQKARLAGLEPATYGLEVRCSIQLSYRRPCVANKILAFPRPDDKRGMLRHPIIMIRGTLVNKRVSKGNYR